MKNTLTLLACAALFPFGIHAATIYVEPTPPYPFYWDPASTNSSATAGGNGTWNTIVRNFYSEGNSSLGVPAQRLVPTPNASGNLAYVNPSSDDILATTSDPDKYPYDIVFNNDGIVNLGFNRFATVGGRTNHYTYNYLRFNGNYTIQSGVVTANGTTLGTGNAIFTVQIAPGKILNVGGNLRHVTLESSLDLSAGPTLSLDGGGTVNLHANTHLRSGNGNGRITVVGNTTINFLPGSAYDNIPAGTNSPVATCRFAIDEGTVNVSGGNIVAAGGVGTYSGIRAPGIYIGNNTTTGTTDPLAVLNVNAGTVKALTIPGNKAASASYVVREILGVSIGAYSNTAPGGILNLNGGTLVTTNIGGNNSGTTGTAIVNLNGGLLKITTEHPPGFSPDNSQMGNLSTGYQKRLDAFMSSTQFRNDAKSHVTIGNDGAFIDTSLIGTDTNPGTGQPLTNGIATISTPIRGTGSLTKLGINTLRLSAINTYTGNTILQEGNLILVGNQTTPLVTALPETILTTNGSSLVAVSLTGNATLEIINNSTIGNFTTNTDATLTLNISATPTAVTPLMISTITTGSKPLHVRVVGATAAQLTSGKTLLTIAGASGISSSDLVLTGLPDGTLWSFDGQTLAILPSSAPATLPVITTPAPASLPVKTTLNATISVIASGTGPLSYQWAKDSSPISTATNPSATSPTLILTNILPSDAGSYTLTITNSAGSITSTPTVLSTIDYYPPSFTKDLPTSLVLKPNATLKLTATATADDNSAITYQWLKDNIPLAGATDKQLIISKAQITDSGNYTLQASNIHGTTDSTTCLVWIGTVPVITTKPQSQSILEGRPLTLSVVVDGTAPFSYQWYRNGDIITDDFTSGISGATTDTLHYVAPTYPMANGTFTVKVSNPLGKASASAVVNIQLAPIFDKDLNGIYSLTPGKTLTMATSIRSKIPLTLRWYDAETGLTLSDGPTLDGSIIKGSTTNKLTISNISENDAGKYYLLATNDVDSTLSAITTVWVGDKPVITQNLPTTIAPIGAGNSTTLNITATGGQTLYYQWYKNNAGLPSTVGDSTYPAFGPSLTVNSSGTYHVKVYNNVGTATSRKLKVTVVETPTITKDLPVTDAFAINSTLSLAFAAKSQTTPTYQWYSSNTSSTTLAPITGANKTSFKASKIQRPSLDGYSYYNATATNIAGTTSTRTAKVWVGSPPKITQHPKSITVHTGDTVDFTSDSTGDDLTHVWIYNSITTINATANVKILDVSPAKTLSGFVGYTTSNLTITETTPGHAGSYSLTVRNPYKTLKAKTAKLSVHLTPSTLSGKTLSLENTGNITFTTNTAFTATLGNSTLSGIYTNQNNNSTTSTLNLVYSAYDPAALNTPLTLSYKTYTTGGIFTGTFKNKTLNGHFTLSPAPAPAPLDTQPQTTSTANSTNSLSIEEESSPSTFSGTSTIPLANALGILRSLLTLPSQPQPSGLLFTFAPIESSAPPIVFPINTGIALSENEDGTLTLVADNATYLLREDGTSTHTNTATGISTEGTFSISQ